MKTIIAGSRNASFQNTLDAINSCPWRSNISQVICGMAKGADLHGWLLANRRGVPVLEMPADWSKGKGAGFDRNSEMADVADCVIAVWDGKSKGTAQMIAIAIARKMPLHIHKFIA